jgi:flagellar assembly protein FliH
MGRMPELEDFDPPAAAPAGPGAEWLAGYEAGVADGRAQERLEQGAIAAETAQAIADLGFGFAEARAHVMAALGPLFAVLVERLVPDLLRDSFGPRILDHLARAARADAAQPLVLRVGEDDAPALARLVAAQSAVAVTVRPDPRLGAGQAVIEGDASGDTSLDLAALERDITEALAAALPQLERTKRHG